MANSKLGILGNVAVQLAIAFLVIAYVYGTVAVPLLNSSLSTAINIANTTNYTSTLQALQTWQTSSGLPLALLVISMLIATIFKVLGSEKRELTIVRDVVMLAVVFIILGVLFFNLGVPVVIQQKIISDAILSAILYILFAGLIIAAIYFLFEGFQATRERHRKSRGAEINIFGRTE